MKKTYFLLMFSPLILLLGFISNNQIQVEPLKELLTLLEAYELANHNLPDGDFILLGIKSFDCVLYNYPEDDTGFDGTKRNWRAWFNKIETDEIITIFMSDGEVSRYDWSQGSLNNFSEINVNDFKIDSPDAIKIILNHEMGNGRKFLLPVDYASGYHFGLQTFIYSDTQEFKPFFTVIGMDEEFFHTYIENETLEITP